MIRGTIFTFFGKRDTKTIPRTTVPITTILTLLIISIMLTGATNVVNVLASTFPGSNGQIAFSSNREDDNYEIYSMHDNGHNVTRLTHDDANDFDPSWSPDGQKMVFTSFRDGSDNEEIYVMNAGNGHNVTRLTHDDALDREPSWSPDGQKIVFVSNRNSIDNSENEELGNNAIYSMNAGNGHNVTRLTHDDNDVNHLYPSWSPDGQKIVFVSNRVGGQNYEIYVMNAGNGHNVTRLTHDDALDITPSWGTNTSSADGNSDDK
jgi:Tol biopolymer transport system component